MTDLDSDACMSLLSDNDIGRIAFVSDDTPVILPVNYVFRSGLIVFRTDPGEKLTEIPMRRVAFEIDGRSDDHSWSVMAQGHARDVTTALGKAYEELRDSVIDVSAPGDKSHWIAIEVTHLSGRMIR